MSLLVLSEADVRRALPMRAAIDAMRPAFAALSAGEATVPVRTAMPLPDGLALTMPAAWPGAGVAGLKWATVHAGNVARGLPAVQALVLLTEAETGDPVALLGATALTAIRTGAGVGLATDLLARPDARVCAVVGAGVQAEAALEAVCTVRPIERAIVVNRTRSRAEAFAAWMMDRLGVDVELADRARLPEADVVCVATASPTPVLFDADVAPGAHVNGIGTHRPDAAEIAPALVRRAVVVVDHRAACAAEAGDLLGAGLDVGALPEVGEVVAGTAAGRPDARAVTLFKSVGNAVQDLAAAAHVVAVARREGLGVTVEV